MGICHTGILLEIWTTTYGDSTWMLRGLPFGKATKKLWKITILIGKSTISMAIFNSYVTNCQRVCFVCICADRQDQNSTSLLGCPRTA